ncbi:Uma2 family endonuclease [soil metagenome]
MEAMISRSTDAPVPLGEFVPTADQRIVMYGLDWSGYQSLLDMRGERPCPRIAYLDGVAELMTPSRDHEGIKSALGRLVEVYCTERAIAWTPYGSWTLDNQAEQAALEPDECYIFGDQPKTKKVPDLAIEVTWTSGGIDKREIYRRLGIREIWFWKRDAIKVFILGPSGYALETMSDQVPGVDFDLLCRFCTVTPTSTAVEQFRAALRRTP